MTVAVGKRQLRRGRRAEAWNPWHRPVEELLPGFRATLGPYARLKPAWAVDYFRRRFLRSLEGRVDFGKTLLVDVGSGFGWLALAWVMAGGRAAVAVDTDLDRLRVLSRLARILAPSCSVWTVVARAESLPFRDGAFGVVTTVEVLEHVGEGVSKRDARARQRQAVRELRRISARWVLLSTPNRWFPWVRHDVSLPAAHWLPYGLKRLYARLFGREGLFARVRLLSIPEIEHALSVSGPVTPFLNFNSPSDWLKSFPHRMPYLPQPGRRVDKRGSLQARAMTLLYRILGKKARYLYPTICGLYAVSGGGRRKP